MMHSPKVSVIIPNYNHADYLKQRIDSVLDQTFDDFEVIILDDNSTDGSQEIIKTYKNHPKIKTIELSEINSGNPFKQWKKGLAYASGNWVWIAESDDYAEPTFLSKTIQATLVNSNLGLVYCDSRVVDDRGPSQITFSTLKNNRFKTQRWTTDHYNNGVDEIQNFLLPAGTINNTSAVLFNRDKLIQSNPFDISFRYIGDKYVFIKVLATSDVAYVSEPLNNYRNPFNTKHEDRLDWYFYEQFLVYDWVYKNLLIPDIELFLKSFYANSRNSVFRGWNRKKVGSYMTLLIKNPFLFRKSFYYNLLMGLKSKVVP